MFDFLPNLKTYQEKRAMKVSRFDLNSNIANSLHLHCQPILLQQALSPFPFQIEATYSVEEDIGRGRSISRRKIGNVRLTRR